MDLTEDEIALVREYRAKNRKREPRHLETEDMIDICEQLRQSLLEDIDRFESSGCPPKDHEHWFWELGMSLLLGNDIFDYWNRLGD
jgi:hypothetical protein